MAHRRKHHPLVRRHHGSSRGTSYKTLGLAAAAGVATVVGLGFAQTKIEMLRTNWYAAPIVLVGGGLLLARRMPTIAVALVAAAGVFGYMGFKANADAIAAQSGAKSGLPASPAAASGYDAGAYRPMARQDSGMFEQSHANAGALQGMGVRGMLAGQAGALMGRSAGAAVHAQGAYGSASGLSD